MRARSNTTKTAFNNMPKPAWDSTNHDLSVHRISRAEVEARRQRLTSPNALAAKAELERRRALLARGSFEQTLAALASKVGLLLESTRFLTCDLQLARILMHMQSSAKALCGAKRAHAVLVRVGSDEVLPVGDRGEVLAGASESLSRGTSFAAHCARSAKPLLVGLPGSPHRAALQFNVDTGTGCRPETALCVPCLDHVGTVLAVIQVREQAPPPPPLATARTARARGPRP